MAVLVTNLVFLLFELALPSSQCWFRSDATEKIVKAAVLGIELRRLYERVKDDNYGNRWRSKRNS